MTTTLPTVRFAHLRAYGRSAMHGKLSRTTEMKQTEPMQVGLALHSLLLGGKRVVGYPGSVRRGKEYDAFVAENPDSTIMTMANYDKANRMAEAVQASELAKPFMQGTYEESIKFAWLGLMCRTTPDIRGTEHITEVKTAMTSDPARFHWHALRMHYHAQMVMQQQAAYQTILGHPVLPCYIVCAESAPPYPVTVFKWTERALEAGNKALVLWAERLKNCELSEQYPPYSQAVVELDVPDEEADLVFGDEAVEEVE